MKKTIIRIAIATLTLSLLALPLAAAATDATGQAGSDRIKYLEDNRWDHDEVDQIAHYEIYIDRETNLSNEIRFIEENVADHNHDYVIDVFFPAQPAGDEDMTKPDGMNQSDWIRFVEDNHWDVEPNAEFADVLPPFQDDPGSDPPMPADENDQLTAHTALCQGEDLMVPLERAFTDYANDVRDYCRNSGLASYAGAQGEGYVDSVNQSLNSY